MTFHPTVFIVNPKAGNGSTGAKWPEIRALSHQRLGQFTTHITQGPGDAVQFCRRAAERGTRLIVGVGGDGTFNEIINGRMLAAGGGPVAFGFIPDGTGCDLVKTLAIPKHVGQAVDVIAAGSIRKMDLGRLTFQGHDGREVVRYFHNVVSFGVGGEVVARVNRSKKRLGPLVSFLSATVGAVLRYGTKPVQIHLDGAPFPTVRIWNVAAANGRFHGGGMQVAPEAQMSDGWLDVTVIGDLSLPSVFRYLPKLYNGKIHTVPKVSLYRCRTIRAASAESVLLDVDGEQPGTLPVTVALMPAAIDVICPVT